LRIASLAGIVASFTAIGVFVRKGDSNVAGLLVFAAVACAILFAWSWRQSFLAPLEWAKRYIEGVEGDERHEWYAFKGQRVRVFLDEKQRPWFPLDEIAFILALKVDEKTFRSYGPNEIGTPEAASEKCLSENGLRRLIKYSSHRDAGALGLWLERDVLRILRNRAARDAT
jgi:hypothetical protein